MARERLDKVLTSLGCGSRREVQTMIRAGRVTVNGQPVRQPACKIDPAEDALTANGQSVRWQSGRYYMLNKPPDVISATEDNFQQTVLSLLPKNLQKGVFPVGRLDKDTEGLLLLTDDGDLGHALTSPRRHVDKVYRTLIHGDIDADAAERFAAGIVLDDGTVCKPAVFEEIGTENELLMAHITLREGKFHQVKRMVCAVGGKVVALKRLSMGSLMLDEKLPPGGWRELTDEELAALKNDVLAKNTKSDDVKQNSYKEI